MCRVIYNDWAKKLISNNYNIAQLQNDITSYGENIVNLNNDITTRTQLLGEYNITHKQLEERKEHILGLRSNDIDQELIRTNPTSLEKEISLLKSQKETNQQNVDSVSVVEPSRYYLEEEHNQLKEKMNQLVVENRLGEREKADKEKHIKLLEEGKICPKCNRPLDEVDHTDEIEETKKEIEEINKDRGNNDKELEDLKKQSESYEALKTEIDTYERNKLRKARYELEVEQKQVEINAKQLKLDNYEANRKKLEDNQKIDTELVTLRTQIESLNGDIRISTTTIERNKNNITSFEEKIGINNDLITKIKAEEELQGVFKTYLLVYGKNGISKTILKNMIPLINQELSRLLSESCYFILELNINDKNELDFIMIDSETRIVKPLNAGSGYERTIASLALRSVLTKVSSLPKPNIVVMDEVFGKVADENLEMVGEFFKKIKNYFEHIFVISHNPLIRNWSDNLIMIKKEENVSSIEYISTKIS